MDDLEIVFDGFSRPGIVLELSQFFTMVFLLSLQGSNQLCFVRVEVRNTRLLKPFRHDSHCLQLTSLLSNLPLVVSHLLLKSFPR